MNQVDWRFPAILIVAMLLGMGLTFLQQQSYSRQLNHALTRASGDHLMLVSGRGRSFMGGAIVILIVDQLTRQVVWASLMAGRTTFARFHDAPHLLGPVDGAVARASGKQVKAAVQMALSQLPSSADVGRRLIKPNTSRLSKPERKQ